MKCALFEKVLTHNDAPKASSLKVCFWLYNILIELASLLFGFVSGGMGAREAYGFH
jgi:hypothetical protein